MKKAISIVLLSVLAVLCFAGCSSDSDTTGTPITSPDDLDGRRVAVQTETTADDYLRAMNEEGKNVDIVRYEKVTQCFDDLGLDRVDAVLVDSVVSAYYMGGDNKYDVVWKSTEGEPMGICLKKGNDALTAAVEAAIDTLYYNGEMENISVKHFGSNYVEGLRTVTEEPVIDTSAISTVKDGVLTIGTEAGYPPMEYTTEDGLTYIGFDIDVANAIGELLGLEVEVVNTAWDGIFEGLNKDQYDCVISAVSITEDRQQAYNMTEAYVANQLVLVTKK